MIRNLPPGTTVLVRWTDASFELDAPHEMPEDCPTVTVGFVWGQNARFLGVAAEHTPIGDRAVTFIPWVLIDPEDGIDVLTKEEP